MGTKKNLYMLCILLVIGIIPLVFGTFGYVTNSDVPDMTIMVAPPAVMAVPPEGSDKEVVHRVIKEMEVWKASNSPTFDSPPTTKPESSPEGIIAIIGAINSMVMGWVMLWLNFRRRT